LIGDIVDMKKISLLAAMMTAFLMMVVSVGAQAHGSHFDGNKGYVTTKDGDVVVTKWKECWENRDWAKGLSVSGCEGDGDNDGVADPLDKCPTTPAGTAVDSDGCALDSDGDGVNNVDDQCPTTPAGDQVDAVGCTLKPAQPVVNDSDDDRILDAYDKCPNSAPGAVVDVDGCEKVTKFILDNVYFETNSARLTPDSTVILDGVADTLMGGNGIKYIQVIGHTDSRGAQAYNLSLSGSRANTVKEYLVSKGVNAGMISSKGMGESAPVDSNNTAAGRAKNRRVEIDVKS
jgi:OmpA-OmpF porin, OOP family